VDIYEPMLNYIEDNAFAEAMEIFMHHFETDLRGRVKPVFLSEVDHG
jgi:hypothetical protein